MLDLSWRTLSPQAKGMRIIQPMAPGQRASHAMSQADSGRMHAATNRQPDMGAVRVCP